MAVRAITVIDGCGASGKSLAPGATYQVPDEVSEKDAELLIQLGRAMESVPDVVAEAPIIAPHPSDSADLEVDQ